MSGSAGAERSRADQEVTVDLRRMEMITLHRGNPTHRSLAFEKRQITFQNHTGWLIIASNQTKYFTTVSLVITLKANIGPLTAPLLDL